MAGSMRISRELCVNTNYRKMHCDFCRQNCPLQCISEDFVIDESRCNDCGICYSACPVEAVFSQTYTESSVEKKWEGQPATIHLCCNKQDQSSAWPCLGFLDPKLLLVLLAEGRQVVVNTHGCRNCKPGVAGYLQGTIEKVNNFLAATGRPLLKQDEVCCENSQSSKTISRRDFFSQMLGATVNTVREVIVPANYLPERLPRMDLFCRYALLDTLSTEGCVQQQIFPSVAIDTGSCKACGLCVKICPQKALTVREENAVLHLWHDPLRCNGCGVCVANCLRDAMSLADAPRLEAYEVAAVPLPLCAGCGQFYQPIGDQKFCFECLLKRKAEIM
ncbi:MAG: hypothetical protein H6Q65_1634 [Firmicutes bacterium]|nr:hypothetical protein [Bacillota bacterium]